jgi:type III secretion protein L
MTSMDEPMDPDERKSGQDEITGTEPAAGKNQEGEGIREPLVHTHELAAAGVRGLSPHEPGDEIPGRDITPDSLRQADGEESATGASDRIRAAQAQARKIVSRAETESDSLLETAARMGREAGASEAEKLVAAARMLRETLLRETEPRLVELALKLAERIISHELDHNELEIARIVGKALEAVRQQRGIVVRVHPSDLERLGAAKPSLSARLGKDKDVELRGDPGVKRGGCMIDTESGSVDASLESQLRLVSDALLGRKEAPRAAPEAKSEAEARPPARQPEIRPVPPSPLENEYLRAERILARYHADLLRKAVDEILENENLFQTSFYTQADDILERYSRRLSGVSAMRSHIQEFLRRPGRAEPN